MAMMYSGPIFNRGQPAAPVASPKWAIQDAFQGELPGLTKSALGIVKSALDGLPSPSESKLENAYFGSRSGLGLGTGGTPTDDFLTNRGYDLFRRRANQQQRGGIQDLLSFVGTYSGAVAPTPGQEIGAQQQAADRAQRGAEFNATMAQQKADQALQLKLLRELTGGVF